MKGGGIPLQPELAKNRQAAERTGERGYNKTGYGLAQNQIRKIADAALEVLGISGRVPRKVVQRAPVVGHCQSLSPTEQRLRVRLQ